MRRLATLTLLLCCACVPRYGTDTLTDPFRGVTEHRMRGNVLGDPDRGGEWVELNAEVISRRGAQPELSLSVVYRDAARWLSIPAGESLLVLADSQLIALSGPGSRATRRTYLGRGVHESATYRVGADQLHRIARAERVRVRIMGSREYIERAFTPRNSRNLREFVAARVAEVPGQGPPGALQH